LPEFQFLLLQSLDIRLKCYGKNKAESYIGPGAFWSAAQACPRETRFQTIDLLQFLPKFGPKGSMGRQRLIYIDFRNRCTKGPAQRVLAFAKLFEPTGRDPRRSLAFGRTWIICGQTDDFFQLVHFSGYIVDIAGYGLGHIGVLSSKAAQCGSAGLHGTGTGRGG